MKKREWGALSFRVRKGTSLFFCRLTLLCDARNGSRCGNEWGGSNRGAAC